MRSFSPGPSSILSTGHGDSDLPVTVQGKVSRDTLRAKLNADGALPKLRSSGGGVTLAPR